MNRSGRGSRYLGGYWGEMGHVRVAFGAPDVDSLSARTNCLGHRCYAFVELGTRMRFHRWKWY